MTGVQTCALPISEGIFLSEEKQIGPLGIVISLYALSAGPEKPILAPLKAFKEFPDSMPYAGAFSTHSEPLLIPRVSEISNRRLEIMDILDGGNPPENVPGDFSFLVFPLPKIGLCYIFYEADEDFPAGVTCLYTNNASSFIPIDGLADVGEYTSRTIINLIEPKR